MIHPKERGPKVTTMEQIRGFDPRLTYMTLVRISIHRTASPQKWVKSAKLSQAGKRGSRRERVWGKSAALRRIRRKLHQAKGMGGEKKEVRGGGSWPRTDYRANRFKLSKGTGNLYKGTSTGTNLEH